MVVGIAVVNILGVNGPLDCFFKQLYQYNHISLYRPILEITPKSKANLLRTL